MRTAISDGFTFLYGDAQPGDAHLLADVHAVDAGIVRWLARGRRCRRLARVAYLFARSEGGPRGSMGMARGAYRNGARE